jgi:hypothetical protein
MVLTLVFDKDASSLAYLLFELDSAGKLLSNELSEKTLHFELSLIDS